MSKCPYDKLGFTECPDTSNCAYCRMPSNPHYCEGSPNPNDCGYLFGELEKSIRNQNVDRALWYLQRLKKALKQTNDTGDTKMALKTEKNKIWYSQCDAVAVVVGDWNLQVGDEIPHDGNDPIDCIQVSDLDWCPQGGHICRSIDGTIMPMDVAIQQIRDEFSPSGWPEQHGYLVAGLQPDAYIVDPRVIAKMW